MTAPRPEFVFLHGLTFDHRMWEPVLAALPQGTPAITPDLPGHGDTPLLAGGGLHPLADHVHEAVLAAGFDEPVVVGHSIGGPIATIYAAEHPVAGVICIDASLRFEPFAAGLKALRPQLEGPRFAEGWRMFKESMHMDRVPAPHRDLIAAGEHASQQVVLTYQADLLERPLADVVAERDAGLAQMRERRLPYLALFGSEIDPEERAWYARALPHADVEVWPVGHHFPHLADPVRFAERLTAFATARVATPAGVRAHRG